MEYHEVFDSKRGEINITFSLFFLSSFEAEKVSLNKRIIFIRYCGGVAEEGMREAGVLHLITLCSVM